VISAKDHGEAFKMLETGPGRGVLYGRCVALRRARQGQGPAQVGGGGEEQSREIYSCMVRKDDPQFLAVVNKTLAELYSSGKSMASTSAGSNNRSRRIT
jgi:ABC-type amino acid transport substrate-binding protein